MRIVLVGDVMLGRLVNRHLASVPPEHPWGDTLSLLRSADALNCQSGVRHFGPRWALAGEDFHLSV